jgi:hypothetical protein
MNTKRNKTRSGISTLFGSQLVNWGRGRKLVTENLSKTLRVNNEREIRLEILYSHSFGKWSWSCNQSLFELSWVELSCFGWLNVVIHLTWWSTIPFRVVYSVAYLWLSQQNHMNTEPLILKDANGLIGSHRIAMLSLHCVIQRRQQWFYTRILSAAKALLIMTYTKI